MIVHHVVPRIFDEASGPSYSVPALCDALAKRDVNVHLHVLEPRPERSLSFPVHAYERSAAPMRLGRSSSMRLSLCETAPNADILHNHSLWMMPNMYAGQAVRGNECRLVVSPRGTLQRWSLRRNRWRKRLVWLLGQSATVQRAACIHATAKSELLAVRGLGLKSPIAVIPNGIDLPADLPRKQMGRKRLLFLGRIHPVKGVDMLISIWSRIESKYPDWDLEIAGPLTNSHATKMQKLARELGAKRILFTGAAYGNEKSLVYRKATVYVLPSHTENFGITIAEALAHGLPVIASRGTPWSQLEQRGCGWWVERHVATLEACIEQAMSMPIDQLEAMGEIGRTWMREDFGWPAIAQQMYRLYEWLLGGGSVPDFVDCRQRSNAA